MTNRIFSPMTEGNGAIVAHRYLASKVPGYVVRGIHPMLGLCGPVLRLMKAPVSTRLLHTVPDLACFFQRRGLPSIVSFQNYVLDPQMSEYSTPMQRFHYRTALRASHQSSVRQADVLTAVSRFTADIARRDLNIAAPIEVIHNGVDHQMFSPLPLESADHKLRLLFAGNPTRRKGIHHLRDLAHGLPASVELQIASGLRGDRAGHLEFPNVRNLGPVSFAAMPDLYRSANVFVAPFFREGLCLAVLEAMASGLPVVAFDSASMSELIEDGKGGFLTPVGDVPAMLRAICTLADSPTMRREMGQFNRALIEAHFTMETMGAAYRQLFERVLDC